MKEGFTRALQEILEDEIPYMVICSKCQWENMVDDVAGFEISRLLEKILKLLEEQ